jgi:hypothetical protein
MREGRPSTCRSCGEEVRWAETVNGKKVMLDPEPTSSGVYALEDRAGTIVAVRIRSPYTGDRYDCHWDTCANKGER